MTQLPVEPAHRLVDRPEQQRWLIEGLWADEAVGIIGGEPKCCKSFLALDMAVSVASGRPCMRHFRVARTGRVLLYAAEDALHIVRSRLDGICGAAGVCLEDVDVQVITAARLRLDHDEDRRRLSETVAALRPVLLLLDPFVRLHRIDENVSGEVAPLLAYLRDIQRRFCVSVALVHHARKGAGKVRQGQALRGSSEFHAWGDSNLYLRRHGEQLRLCAEHRAAPSMSDVSLTLATDEQAVALAVVGTPPTTSVEVATGAYDPQLARKVHVALVEAGKPLTVVALRHACRVRTQTLTRALTALVAAGRLIHTPAGYRLIELD